MAKLSLFVQGWSAMLIVSLPVVAQEAPAKKPITFEAMLAGKIPMPRTDVGTRRGPAFAGQAWLPDGEHYLGVNAAGKRVKVNARSGAESELPAAEGLQKSLLALDGMKAESVEVMARGTGFAKDATGRICFQLAAGEYALANPDGSAAKKFPKLPEGSTLASLSPTGNFLGFVKGGNLGTAKLEADVPTMRTSDASETVLNGTADWVYEEEIFDRNPKAYWWGPNDRLAFLRFDDKPVPKFPIAGMMKRGADLETLNYPKAGDANPLVKLGVLDAATGDVTFLDLGAVNPTDFVVCRVGWWPGQAGKPYAYLQNRTQTHLDVAVWHDLKSKPTILFRDTTEAWVMDPGAPSVLPDGSFLFFSERSGWKHLYRYGADGKLMNAVTSGEWEALTLERIDFDAGEVIVSGTYEAGNGRQLVKAKLDGSKTERLTKEAGTHAVTIAPKGTLFIDRHSDIAVLPTVTIRDAATGEIVRTLSATKLPPEHDQYSWGKVERVKIPAADGYLLEGILTYPPNFDPAKKYPMWVMTYAGPHTPTVRDAYSPRLMEQVLANAGILALNVDPRAASGKGAASAWTAYRKLGSGELKDLEDAVGWVAAKGFLDDTKVGLQGHSYGGYITAYALTHSKVFSAGISGAPVTDWALYDTIYTERYMGLPKENKEGYAKSSVVNAAANLHGKLLLIHGMIDDNVHLQNTAQFIQALQRADKQFEVMVYPSSRHGIGGIHYQKLMMNFIRKTMTPDAKP